MSHTVEKIGGTSMSDYQAVLNNIIRPNQPDASLYGRIFVVSAYGGVTNALLEHKKTGEPGVFAHFASDDNHWSWVGALAKAGDAMQAINDRLFTDPSLQAQADQFITERIEGARSCMTDLLRLTSYGHFNLSGQLQTVRELLASLGEAHSAFNLALLLQAEGVNARFIDLTGWRDADLQPLDDKITQAFAEIDPGKELPIVTGYAQCQEGLMNTFDRGYSEMTFSRIASLTGAREAIIHKEYHLSSADPNIVGVDEAVPIGRTNYDVADQLANLGMEAIHPRAAKGLRKQGIPIRVKNTFEPDHSGTLIDTDYVSQEPCVEIIAGRQNVVAIELFDQDMAGERSIEPQIQAILEQFKVRVLGKDLNANSITHYVDAGLKKVRRVVEGLQQHFPGAEFSTRKVCIVSAIGSDMTIPGVLSRSVSALAEHDIGVVALQQTMRQVEIRFVIDDKEYAEAVKALHRCLIEPHNHEYAICAA
ncbi:aspartate kinase [Ferrimonas gelatinilytica]|uniref:aspartate kinase n=1 Tax=Ferrimonas gelatinilytica TaxID=1255257 RepID=A0ABP9S017_9GAMM